MFTLTFKGPDGSEQTAQLEAEVSVGREEGNDLVLPDSAVSRRHCRFFVEGEQVVVEDLGSSNGVVVDGERIGGPTAVSEKSEIFVAEWQVHLGNGEAARPSPKRKGPDGPTKERPKGSNGARPTRQLNSPRPGRALARPDDSPARSGKPSPSERNAVAKPSSGAVRASIKGLTGPWTGKSFNLTRPVTVVGRAPPADIVVDDDSVSRRHLEIRKLPLGYLIRDLGSANGISVNDDSVIEHPLQNGDQVRMGVVTFSYSGPSAPKPGMPARKKRLLLIAGAGGILILAIVAVAALGGNSGSQNAVAPEPEKMASESVSGKMSLCKLYSDTDSNDLDWGKAYEKCTEVLKLDPLNVEAAQLQKTSKREREWEAILKEGRRLSEVGRDEEAVEKFLGIEKKSYYFRRARQGFLDAQKHISIKYKDECRSWSYNGRDWCKAADYCAKYLDYNCCNTPPDFAEDKKRLDKAIFNCGAKATPWACPQRFCDMIGRTAPGGSESGSNEELKGKLLVKYSHPKVVDEMLEYAKKGNPRKIADDLRRFRVTSDGQKMAKVLDQTITDLEVVDGRYTTGAPMIERDPDSAFKMFQDAFEADARLMPPGERGDVVRRMKTELSAGYLKQAQTRFDQDRFPEAAPFAFKALEQNPSNTEVIELISKLEATADRFMTGGCASLAKAKKLLRPSNPKMQEVQARSRKLNCPE